MPFQFGFVEYPMIDDMCMRKINEELLHYMQSEKKWSKENTKNTDCKHTERLNLDSLVKAIM